MSYWNGKTAVVTGGAGMIGGTLATFLRDAGASVRVLDNLSRGRRRIEGTDFTYGDAGNEGVCRDVFKNADAVFNLAATVAGVEWNQSHNLAMFYQNLRLVTVPLRVASEYGIPFLQTSSVCIYADGYNNPAREENGLLGEPEGANRGYAWAKRAGEYAIQFAVEQGDFHAVIVRPTNAYGPCFSGDTDVMTPKGLRNIRDLKMGDSVYSLNPETHQVELARIAATVQVQASEFFNFGGRAVDFRVTPDHKMYYRTQTAFQKRPAEWFRKRAGKQYGQVTLADHHPWVVEEGVLTTVCLDDHIDEGHVREGNVVRDYIHSHSRYVPTQYNAEDWAEFLGWFISEGSIGRIPSKNGVSWQICIHQRADTNPQNVERIAELLTRMGLAYGYKGKVFYFASRLLKNYLEQHVGIGARNKRIPREFLSAAYSLECRQRLFTGLMLGDGDADGGRYTTASDKLKDDFLLLCFLLGIRACAKRDEDSDCWRVRLRTKTKACIKYRHISFEDVDETAYCITIDRNHLVYAGRNGKLNWIGQCDYFDERAHVIPALIRKCLDDDPIVVNGTGEEVREFIYADDVARGMMAALEHGKAGEAYNLGTSGCTAVPIWELLQLIMELTDMTHKRHAYKQLFSSGDDVRRTDSSKAFAKLHWLRQVRLPNGLLKTIDWYLEHRDV